jgi:hypothetical protein
VIDRAVGGSLARWVPPRRPLPPRLVAAFFLAAVLVALLVPAPAGVVRAAAYDRFYANFAGEELMRAINADRVALGRSPYVADPVLEGIARDRPATCPSNASLTIRGRARDMADRGYLGHTVPGCQDATGAAFDTFSLLHLFGYGYASAGEAVANNDYPTRATTYATGCDVGGGSCRGSLTMPWTVARAEQTFMGSSLHRALVLSTTFTRFGCGAWNDASGTRVYACYFVSKGTGSSDTAGPALSSLSGKGASFAAGSTPTFTAVATDSQSVLSDGSAEIDGLRIKAWAWDHVGRSADLSAKAPPLAVGSHTFRWTVRDASTRSRTVSFTFTIGSASTPRPTTEPRPRPTPSATPPSATIAPPSAAPSPSVATPSGASSSGSASTSAPLPGGGGGPLQPASAAPEGASHAAAAGGGASTGIGMLVIALGVLLVVGFGLGARRSDDT